VSRLIIGLLGVLVAIKLPAETTNLAASKATNGVIQTTNAFEAAAATNDPVESEFKRLMAEDDAAQAEVDRWIQEDQAFVAAGGVASGNLRQRIRERMQGIAQGYREFIKEHPQHAKARVAYGSLLGDMNDEDGAQEQLEAALKLDTNDPAIYNNLANIYGHHGPVTNAFDFYARAIKLNPNEPVYYQNFGTTVYLFRQDAKEYFGFTEDQVFAKAFELYSNAMRLAPDDFPLATDVAETYYGVRPMRTEAALKAWTNALNIAHDEIEREGVYIHFARIKLMAKRFDEARAHLNAVTNTMYAEMKRRIARNLDEQEAEAKGTNLTSATNAPPKTNGPASQADKPSQDTGMPSRRLVGQ